MYRPTANGIIVHNSLEQDADVVLFLHRDWMSGIPQDENGNSTQFEADLVARKWRNGALTEIKLQFEPVPLHINEQRGQRCIK